MAQFITVYLYVTGIIAGLALGFPMLVALGMFVFFVPGLILICAPTAFLWGCIFALSYWLAGKVAGRATTPWLALATTAFLLWAIPQPSLHLANETLSKYDLLDVMPAAQIQPSGDILLASQREIWSRAQPAKIGSAAYSCDNRCLALLFEPEVSSVTMSAELASTIEQLRDGTSETHGQSLTYRLLAKDQCGDRALDPDLGRRSGHFGQTLDDQRAMVAEWGLQLTTRFCLVGDPPLDSFDMVVRSGSWRQYPTEGPQSGRWSLLGRGAVADFEEIRNDRNEVLVRRFDLSTRALSVPLAVGADSGSGGIAVLFAWATQTVPHRNTSDSEPLRVDALLQVQRTSDPQAGLAAAREAVTVMLADLAPVSPAYASALIGNYMEILNTTAAEPADSELIADLLANPHIDDLPGAWVLNRKLSVDQLLDLLPAAVHKLATAPETSSPRSNLGEYLENWPAGAFANLTQDMRDLLADPIRRRRATGLIARLSDMGASAAPVVADIMVWHAAALANQKSRDKTVPSGPVVQTHADHMAVIDAGRRAMCRLGSLAGGQLSKMLDVEGRIALLSDEQRKWDTMMVRLGRPTIEINSPSSNSDEDYRESLSWQAAQEDEKACN